jgi:hypothetical protein
MRRCLLNIITNSERKASGLIDGTIFLNQYIEMNRVDNEQIEGDLLLTDQTHFLMIIVFRSRSRFLCKPHPLKFLPTGYQCSFKMLLASQASDAACTSFTVTIDALLYAAKKSNGKQEKRYEQNQWQFDGMTTPNVLVQAQLIPVLALIILSISSCTLIFVAFPSTVVSPFMTPSYNSARGFMH